MPFRWADLIAQKDELVQDYRAHKYESLLDDSERIRVISGQATLLSDDEVQVELIPHLPGLSDLPYLTSDWLSGPDDPWKTELREQPPSLLIVGGSYIALELGQMFARFGTQVTLMTHGNSLLPGYEPEVAATLTTILREEGLHIVTGAQISSVERADEGVRLTSQRHGNWQTFTASKLLIATGRRPATSVLGLSQIGVELDAMGAVRVDKTLQTSVPHIWAAGDVIGGQIESQMATPVGAHDGKIAAHNALSGEPPSQVDHRVIPRVVFTDPQVAVVGMTHEQALEAGIICTCKTIPFSVVPRTGAIHDPHGAIKMVTERGSRRVLGVSMCGANAGEVIHEAAMALRFGATVDDFMDMIQVYPMMAEALKLVAIAFTKGRLDNSPGAQGSRSECCATTRIAASWLLWAAVRAIIVSSMKEHCAACRSCRTCAPWG